MLKKIGEPCPKCAAALIRRRSTFRAVDGDVAYCGPCNAAFELAPEPALAEPFVFARPLTA